MIRRRKKSDKTTKRMSSHGWCCHEAQLLDEIKNNVRLFNHTKLCWSLRCFFYFNYSRVIYFDKRRNRKWRLLPNWNSWCWWWWMSECYLIWFTMIKSMSSMKKIRKDDLMQWVIKLGAATFSFSFFFVVRV